MKSNTWTIRRQGNILASVHSAKVVITRRRSHPNGRDRVYTAVLHVPGPTPLIIEWKSNEFISLNEVCRAANLTRDKRGKWHWSRIVRIREVKPLAA